MILIACVNQQWQILTYFIIRNSYAILIKIKIIWLFYYLFNVRNPLTVFYRINQLWQIVTHFITRNRGKILRIYYALIDGFQEKSEIAFFVGQVKIWKVADWETFLITCFHQLCYIDTYLNIRNSYAIIVIQI